jgi:TRAP-type C4-dicarboxylate transport system substrate-binding protein
MATEYPATTVSGQGIAFFADRLAKESSGKLTIALAYDEPGGPKSADIVAAVRDGRLAASGAVDAWKRDAGADAAAVLAATGR